MKAIKIIFLTFLITFLAGCSYLNSEDRREFETIYTNENIEVLFTSNSAYDGHYQVVYSSDKKEYAFGDSIMQNYKVIIDGEEYTLSYLFESELLTDEELKQIPFDVPLVIKDLE